MLLVAFPGTPRKTANCPQHRRESEQRTLPWTGRRPTARLDFRRGSRGKRHFVCMSYRCPFPGRQDVALPPAPHALHGYPLRTPRLASSAQYFLLGFIQFRMWVGGASHTHVCPASRKGPRGPQAGERRHEPRGGRLQRGSCRRGKDLDFCSGGHPTNLQPETHNSDLVTLLLDLLPPGGGRLALCPFFGPCRPRCTEKWPCPAPVGRGDHPPPPTADPLPESEVRGALNLLPTVRPGMEADEGSQAWGQLVPTE